MFWLYELQFLLVAYFVLGGPKHTSIRNNWIEKIAKIYKLYLSQFNYKLEKSWRGQATAIQLDSTPISSCSGSQYPEFCFDLDSSVGIL